MPNRYNPPTPIGDNFTSLACIYLMNRVDYPKSRELTKPGNSQSQEIHKARKFT